MPYPISALCAVRKIIVHKQTSTEPCADGRASALVLHAALPHVPIVEMAYGDPDHEALQPEPGLLFCDFSPPKARLTEFACAGGLAGFVRGEVGSMVLDHHEAKIVPPFGELGVFGDNAKAESGALLAFQTFGPLVEDGDALLALREVAGLAALRDTWQTMSPRWDDACAMTMALRLPSLEKLLSMGPRRFLQFAEEAGPMLVQSKQDSVRRVAESALWMRIGEVRVAVVPSLGLASDVAELLAPCGADLVVGAAYVHERGEQAGQRIRLQFSLRSRGKVNATALAAHFGGGGHENGRAAGFRLDVQTGVGCCVAPELNLYARLERLLVDALSDPAVRARVVVGPS